MRFSLSVEDVGIEKRKSTLYIFDLPEVNVWLPEDAYVSIPFGNPDEHGITEPVARCFFTIEKGQVDVELNKVYLDASDNYLHRRASCWRHDSFDGQVRTMEEFSQHVHEGLIQGGWKVYTGE